MSHQFSDPEALIADMGQRARAAA
ncbi:MAG: hypothetical protein JWM75_579, partial [Sphingomonas bacterium]|nr:hypothetical protein [Sphingomonas bacterium]